MTTGKKKRQWVLAEFCEFWEHQILNAVRRVRSCAALHPTECPPHADRIRMSCMRSRALATSNVH